jgi:hypothetical protein
VKLRTVRASTSSSDERVAMKYEQSGGSQTDHEEAGNEARVGTTTLHRLGWARDRTQHSAETDGSDVDGAALGCPRANISLSPTRPRVHMEMDRILALGTRVPTRRSPKRPVRMWAMAAATGTACR